MKDTCFALGYAGNEQYKCSCGVLISSPGLIPVEGFYAIAAVKDQWNAHRKENQK